MRCGPFLGSALECVAAGFVRIRSPFLDIFISGCVLLGLSIRAVINGDRAIHDSLLRRW